MGHKAPAFRITYYDSPPKDAVTLVLLISTFTLTTRDNSF